MSRTRSVNQQNINSGHLARSTYLGLLGTVGTFQVQTTSPERSALGTSKGSASAGRSMSLTACAQGPRTVRVQRLRPWQCARSSMERALGCLGAAVQKGGEGVTGIPGPGGPLKKQRGHTTPKARSRRCYPWAVLGPAGSQFVIRGGIVGFLAPKHIGLVDASQGVTSSSGRTASPYGISAWGGRGAFGSVGPLGTESTEGGLSGSPSALALRTR